jgi:[ribosomal protein S5]-alanine N-acetyltransferase
MIETARLRILPATMAMAKAEIDDRPQFRTLLGAEVPDNWPPETLADALPLFLGWMEAEPDLVGWLIWYGLAVDDRTPVLVGSGGFKGKPQGGAVEIGYSVLPQFQGQGYGTEMVRGLVVWAMEQAGVEVVMAETEGDNPGSVRVLEKVGFRVIHQVLESGGQRFEYRIKD